MKQNIASNGFTIYNVQCTPVEIHSKDGSSMTPRDIRISSVVLLALLVFCGKNTAQNPGGPQAPGPTPGSGPYKAVMEMDTGLPDHTIYRPEDLSVLNGTKLPVVVWGNGACVNAGNAFSSFLTDISSYGYLVIALGPIVQRDPFGPAQPAPQAPATPLPPQGADSTEPPRGLPPAATHANAATATRPRTPG